MNGSVSPPSSLPEFSASLEKYLQRIALLPLGLCNLKKIHSSFQAYLDSKFEYLEQLQTSLKDSFTTISIEEIKQSNKKALQGSYIKHFHSEIEWEDVYTQLKNQFEQWYKYIKEVDETKQKERVEEVMSELQSKLGAIINEHSEEATKKTKERIISQTNYENECESKRLEELKKTNKNNLDAALTFNYEEEVYNLMNLDFQILKKGKIKAIINATWDNGTKNPKTLEMVENLAEEIKTQATEIQKKRNEKDKKLPIKQLSYKCKSLKGSLRDIQNVCSKVNTQFEITALFSVKPKTTEKLKKRVSWEDESKT